MNLIQCLRPKVDYVPLGLAVVWRCWLFRSSKKKVPSPTALIRRRVCLVRANGLVIIYGVMVPVINDDVRLKIHSPKCVKLYQIISHAHLPQSWSPVVRKE